MASCIQLPAQPCILCHLTSQLIHNSFDSQLFSYTHLPSPPKDICHVFKYLHASLFDDSVLGRRSILTNNANKHGEKLDRVLRPRKYTCLLTI